ncbi:MAG: tetratricopeptide repeat protein [Pseudomonadota bacterium]
MGCKAMNGFCQIDPILSIITCQYRLLKCWLYFFLFLLLLQPLQGCSQLKGPGGFSSLKPNQTTPETEPLFLTESNRKPPRSLPLNRPVQITSEVDPVLYGAVSPDGQWLVYPSSRDGLTGLWLRSADPSRVELPKRLIQEVSRLSSPVFSQDGRWIAFVGTRHDVKGDIYLLKLNEKDARPLRITGRETEDGAPCFSHDGKTLCFHQIRPGESRRQLMILDLKSNDPEPRLLDTGGDGAFPSLSPDGRQCAFVSFREDPGGDIFLADLVSGKVIGLTKGPERDLFPVWSQDGQELYFSRFSLDTDRDGSVTFNDNAAIFRLQVNGERPCAYPVTSASYSAYQPIVTKLRLYFLSNRGGVSNLWALPLEGEIPQREDAQTQMELAEELVNQVPPDHHLAILGFYKVLERFSEQGPLGGQAAYAMGLLYERMGLPEAAEQAFRLASESFSRVLPQAALGRIHLVRLKAERQWRRAHTDKERRDLLSEALFQLDAISKEYPGRVRIQAQGLIEQTRLLKAFGGDAESLLGAIRLLEKVMVLGSADRPQLAQAIVLRADLFSQVGRVEELLPAYTKVIKEFSDVEEWADRAVARILDLSMTEAASGTLDEKTRILADMAERYRNDLPRLAVGAWNRIGDIAFWQDEWMRAKEAYRQVLEQFPVIASQTAAARLALAEVLYREERFRETLDLYEKEMAIRPYEDHLYHLARSGYIRKSIAAGEFLFRLGEVPSARNLFGNLIRYDYSIVEAHRGYIKCAAAQKQLADVMAHYERRLTSGPIDPVTLYSAGLCLTYKGDKKSLEKARSLIHRAIQQQGQVEYFHQTLGYTLEILETVHGEPGRLEAAIESYQRAYFLNDPKGNPENRANLSLNVGNVYFLLGQYGKAFEFYSKRFQSGLPFDHEETEILFYRRFGAAAFQVRDHAQSIEAFSKSLELIEKRIDPKRASEILGRVNRSIVDRILTPAMQNPPLGKKAREIAERQGSLNARLHEVSRRPVNPPPDPTWMEYRKEIESLISRQKELLGELRPLIQKDREGSLESLAYMMARTQDALGFPERLMDLKAEMLDRLGLAYQEAGQWKKARETFEQAFNLNQRQGLFGNLVSNQRSIAYNAYMEAGNLSGKERRELLHLSSEGFKRVIELVKRYGVAEKGLETRKKAVISLAFDVTLDKVSATEAMYGFSADQEVRLAESFIYRIQTELGQLIPAQDALNRQLALYPSERPIPEKDRYGISLLYHRDGHLSYALRNMQDAFDHFQRSAQLSYQLKNPVSMAINVMNMAQTLNIMWTQGPDMGRRLGQLANLDKKTTELLERSGNILERPVIPSYHNTMGVLAMTLSRKIPTDSLEKSVQGMELLQRSGRHFSKGLKVLERYEKTNDRGLLVLRAALHLNMAGLARALGEDARAHGHFERSLDIARRGLLPEYEWRALVGLRRLREGFKVLESLPILRSKCGPGEITENFAPLVTELLRAGETEKAFNMVEQLSEMERVQRLIPLTLGPIPEEEKTLLLRIYPRLMVIQELKKKIAAAKGEERTYLTRRLGVEKELFERERGSNRERLPSLVLLTRNEAIQESIIILLGLAVHAEVLADTAVKTGADMEAVSLRKRYDDLIDQYKRVFKESKATIQEGEAPGIMGLLGPDPVEAIDVMENLPANTACVRFFPIPNDKQEWVAFTITPETIQARRIETASDLDLPTGRLNVAVYEDPSRMPFQFRGPIALSATHMVRCIKNRRPFKRKILMVPLKYLLPQSFQSTSLPASTTDSEVVRALSETNTILFSGGIFNAGSVPTRPGQGPVPFMAMELDRGRTLPLLTLAEQMPNVSLAVLPGVALSEAYPVGHLFSLLGVPTLLLPRTPQSDSRFIEPFFQAYKQLSAAEALQVARSGENRGEGWVQMGYWGMTSEEARLFAKENFTRYVEMGVQAFKTHRPGQALALFENALNVASETEALKAYLPDLHRYARESAYGADLIERAIQHAQTLVNIISEKQPDSEAHAEALIKLGLLQARAEQYARAIPALRGAADMMGNLELGTPQVEALSDLGVVLENATEYDRALVQFKSAASLSRALNKKELLARQHMSIGRIYDLRLSQYGRARQSYGEAYSIYHELGQKGNMAQSLLDMGRCYRLLGNFKEADEHYRKASDLVETDASRLRLRAKIMIEQANNAWYQARYQEAFDLQKRVYDLARRNEWDLEQVISLNTAGLIWWTLGDNRRALRELEEALALARNLRVRSDEVATTLNNMGLVYREMGRFQEALEALNKALAIDREINSRWAVAYDLRNKALTLLRMGEPEKAVPLFKEALATAAGIGNRINEAKILLGFGEALFRLGRYGEARGVLENALKLSLSMLLRETEWRALYGLAQLSLKEGDKEKAKDLLTRAVSVIEGMRAAIKLDQLKDGFIANKMTVYETLVTLLVDHGETAKAFDTAERSRARNLIDLLGNQRLTLHGAVDQELYDRQNTLRSRIREHEALVAQAGDEGERSAYGKALGRLQDEYRDLMLEIQVKNPELASIISIAPLSLGDLQSLLDPGIALLAYYVVPDEILCWLVRPKSVQLFRIPMGRETLESAIAGYRRMIQNLEPLETRSRELYSLLFSQMMPALSSEPSNLSAEGEGVRVLGIVPHGPLHYLSFATLQDGENYLADRFSLFYLPSGSVFRYTLQRRKELKNARVLAIGNPDLGNPAMNLPFAEHEVATIGWNFPDITVLTKEKATESWVAGHIQEFGIIHMASHGEFDPINPLFSAVKLVKDMEKDGDLEASEVFGLRINADLVVLSACQTGLGRVTGGDDVIGMNRAFLYAGTHAIVSSLWRVSDISTAILVKQFYREYARGNKSDSLRRAILHVKNRYPHPGYWGAFLLVGDYY